jgi:Tat protein secretion system quality control protein TatD with DNase activity
LAVKAIAGIKGIPEQQVAETVAANTIRLYGRLVG